MGNDNEVVITAEHLAKTFYSQSSNKTIKEGFINLGRKLQGKREQTHHKGEYTALKDISFEVKKGEFFGIVGRNGSGKSTLLKILAGVYTPTKGNVQINGKLTPFIELGVGFNPELSGRDNVFLNGALLGFTRKQMEEMYDSIVEFAELEQFMDTKLKNYSSGMQVRLAFSVAIRAQSDILLIDEVLAVGDAAFQAKCFDYFTRLKQSKRTVILVTHDMVAMQRFCTKAMLIEGGDVVKVGTGAEISQLYKDIFTIQDHVSVDDKKNNPKKTTDKIHDIRFEVQKKGLVVNKILSHETFSIVVEMRSVQDVNKAALGINVTDSEGTIVMSMGVGGAYEKPFKIKKGVNRIVFEITENILRNDTYTLNATIESYQADDKGVVLYQETNILNFLSEGVRARNYALIHPRLTISLSDSREEAQESHSS